ncbi:MAG: adenosine kinase, partial [Luminiphilus sp.]|nr:adenosine kinase [Luminiphilus sp.]
ETLSVNEVDDRAIVDSDWVYLEGYLVSSPTGLAAALHTRAVAEANGVKTSVSFSDPGMVQFFRDNMKQLVGEQVDLVFCNEAEALEWAEADNLADAAEVIKQVASSFVITRGADGVIAFDGETTVEVPAHKVDAVNTNGAGDMFAGAFLYGLARGENYERAAKFAVRAAGEVVKYFGPRLKPEEYRALRHSFFGD